MAHSVSQSGGTTIVYDEENTLASDVETSLVLYTNNTEYPLFIDSIKASGQAEAIYRILYKSSTVFKKRTTGSDLDMDFDIPNGLLLKPSETIEIKVTNCHTTVADFSGTLILHRTG